MARKSLALQAYLAYVHGGTGAEAPDLSPTVGPHGRVLLVAEGRENGAALAGLVARLIQHRPDMAVFGAGDLPEHSGMRMLTLPEERGLDCEAFAAALRPSVVVWAARRLRPALLDAMSQAGARLIMVNADKTGFETPARRWLPDPTQSTLSLFDEIHAVDQDAARRLRRNGIEAARLRVSGALLDTNLPPECSDALHEEMAAVLAGRPVWLAAHVRADEALSVLRAHRQATRLAHRLLLIAVPDDTLGHAALKAAGEELQMRFCHWDDGNMPDENSQVLLTETPEDLGLWYRLSPLAFIGNSLVPGCGGRDPFDAASLGVALLYGPNVGHWLEAYSRLVEAGAARIVRDAESLSAGVTHLISPEQSAAMALAGWDVVSGSAELTDRLIASICDRADEKEGA